MVSTTTSVTLALYITPPCNATTASYLVASNDEYTSPRHIDPWWSKSRLDISPTKTQTLLRLRNSTNRLSHYGPTGLYNRHIIATDITLSHYAGLLLTRSFRRREAPKFPSRVGATAPECPVQLHRGCPESARMRLASLIAFHVEIFEASRKTRYNLVTHTGPEHRSP
jgi:hypothetical protein